jgi:hypothetical protein
MGDVAELIKRAEDLQTHVEALLGRLRQALDRMQCESATPVAHSEDKMHDCLAVALALAEDLGPDFASEDPHGLTARGEDWFKAP